MNFVFDSVTVRFDGIPVLDSVSFNLQAGGAVLLTGASGAGKTTLLRLMYGACRPSAGTLLLNGMDAAAIKASKLRKLRTKMGVVFQDARLIPAFTVYQNVMLPLIISGHSKRAADSRCLDVMSDLGISYLREKFPAQLSGGERQLCALARALVAYPDCIVADEPTAQLDSGSVERIVQALMREHARGATLIVATHDELVVQRFSGVGRLHLNEGRIEHALMPTVEVPSSEVV
ncbi:MAG: cell division ATP-binding protein FtsE [Candidatus Kapaibacterium sp.]|jgi:cell division transport system ATP-binding protein